MKYNLIRFDTSGITTDCPKSDLGGATSAECKDCPSFIRFQGFNVVCESGEPEIREKWRFMHEAFLLKGFSSYYIRLRKWRILIGFHFLAITLGWEKCLEGILEIDKKMWVKWAKEQAENLKNQ